MSPLARRPRAGRRSRAPLPEAMTDRTDRLVEISDHCAAAKKIAEALGEDFLVYLLSMAGQEAAAAMRRTTTGAPAPRKARPRAKSSA